MKTDDDPRLDSLACTMSRLGVIEPRFRFSARTPDEIAAWKDHARRKLTELIGPFSTGRVPLDPRVGEIVDRGTYTRRSVRFATRPDMDAFGYLLVPKVHSQPAPAIVCIPGHGRGVDDIVGIDEHGRDRDADAGYQHDFAVQCVRQGYVALALEPLGFGHRRDPSARERGHTAGSCQPTAGAALMLGETMVGWRVWDAWRAVDLLESLPEVDPNRLGMMGISGGGTVILYAAALDERVSVSVLSCSFCTFRDSIFRVSHCIDNYVPGILQWFEAAEIAGLIAPRFLFCESGIQDDLFPEAGVRECLARAAEIYDAQGAAERLDHAFFDAGHEFDGRRAFARLKTWFSIS